MKRAGLRFLGAGSFRDTKKGGFRRFSNLISKDFFGEIEKSVDGDTEDLAITLTGKTKDNLGYRIACGPTAKSDLVTLFLLPTEDTKSEMLKEYDFSFDIDLFEFNTSFLEHNLFRWATTKLEKAVEVVATFEKVAS